MLWAISQSGPSHQPTTRKIKRRESSRGRKKSTAGKPFPFPPFPAETLLRRATKPSNDGESRRPIVLPLPRGCSGGATGPHLRFLARRRRRRRAPRPNAGNSSSPPSAVYQYQYQSIHSPPPPILLKFVRFDLAGSRRRREEAEGPGSRGQEASGEAAGLCCAVL